MLSNWPIGPSTLDELFNWGHYNAKQLLKESVDSTSLRENFKKLMDFEIWVNESYGGMGTGGYTLHLQHSHLVRKNLSFPLLILFHFLFSPFFLFILT